MECCWEPTREHQQPKGAHTKMVLDRCRRDFLIEREDRYQLCIDVFRAVAANAHFFHRSLGLTFKVILPTRMALNSCNSWTP
jgi:hypothetical protein